MRRHRPRLFSLAFRLTGQRETAEDVVQETFIARVPHDRALRAPAVPVAWLNTILIRTAGRAAERIEARSGPSLDALLDDDDLLLEHVAAARLAPDDDPAAAAEAAELRATLPRAIASLPFRYRAAVVTRFVLGMDYAEAAAALDTGLNTYKSHLLRGTRILREALPASARSRRGCRRSSRCRAEARRLSSAASRSASRIERSQPSTALSAAGSDGRRWPRSAGRIRPRAESGADPSPA